MGWVKLLEFLADQERKEKSQHCSEEAQEIEISTGGHCFENNHENYKND
jgi:hypothetical protein